MQRAFHVGNDILLKSLYQMENGTCQSAAVHLERHAGCTYDQAVETFLGRD